MADNTTVENTLAHLRSVSRALVRQIEFEMTRLESTGIAPSSKTLAAINDFRIAVAKLGAAIAPGRTFESLDGVEQALRQRSTADLLGRVLEPLIAFQHSEEPQFRPLDELQKAAVRLEGEIQKGAGSPETLAELASGTHPWCRLLALVVRGHDLGDALWGEHYDVVEAALGRSMAIAATRGKLKLPANLAKVVIGEAPAGPPRETVAVPRTEELDPLLLNRPSRIPGKESRESDAIFEGSPHSGIHSGPDERDLSQLDDLEDPEGGNALWTDGIADFHELFEEMSLDSEASSVTSPPPGLVAAAAESVADEEPVSATAAPSVPPAEPVVARPGSMDSDSRLVGDDVLQARSEASTGEFAHPRRKNEKFLGTSSAELLMLPPSGSRASGTLVSQFAAGGARSVSQASGIAVLPRTRAGEGRPVAPTDHSDDPVPCPQCGSDLFPAMARCRSCGLVVKEESAASGTSTVSGLFRTAPEARPQDFLRTAPPADEASHETGFELNPVAAPPPGRSLSSRTGVFAPPAQLQSGGGAAGDAPRKSASSESVVTPAKAGDGVNSTSRNEASGKSSASRTFEVKGQTSTQKLRTICDKCTEEFQVPRALASQPVACPSCGEMTLAPTADPTDEFDIPITTTDVDITLYTVRQAVEEALTQPCPVADRVWERPLSKSQWKNLSGAIATIAPTAGPFECERVKPLLEVLGQSSDERAAELLRTRWPELPAGLHGEVVKALERLQDPLALPLMMRLLYEEKSPGTLPAISALAALGDLRAVRPLVLLGVAAPEQRNRVIMAIAAFGDRVVPTLAGLCVAEHPDAVRFVAVETLGRLKSSKAIPPLMTVLKEGSRLLQRLAAEGLSHVTSKKVIRPLIEALQNPDEMVRVHASAGLLTNPDPKSAKFLIRSLRDKSLDVRKNIVAAIGLCGDESVVNSLKKFLVDPSREMIVIAAEAIGRLGQNSAVPALVKMLEEEVERDEDRPLIQRIFKALHTLKDRRAVVPLISYLESTDALIRRRAVEALGPIPDAAARRSLENALRTDRSDEVRAAAALALGEQGQKHAIPALEVALAGGERVKINALRAIGLLQERTSLSKVLPLLNDQNLKVRHAAINCLGAIGNTEAVPRLLEMLHDLDLETRNLVMAALPLLGESRSEGELLGTVKPRPAASQASTKSTTSTIQPPRPMPKAANRRSLLSSATDFAVGMFGNPFSNMDEVPWKKVASIGSGVVALVVAVGFFAVRGNGIPPYRRAYVASAAISNDGKRSATGRTSQGVEIWAVDTKGITDYKPSLPNHFLAFGSSGDRLACVGGQAVVLAMLDPSGRVTEAREMGSHASVIKLYNASLDGKWLLTVDAATARVWSVDEGKLAYEFPVASGFESPIMPLATSLIGASISEDGTCVAIGTVRDGARVWKNGQLIGKKLSPATDLFKVALNADGTSIVLLQKRGVTTIANVEDGRQTKPFRLADIFTSGLLYVDANTILQVCGDQMLTWDLAKMESKKITVDLPSMNVFDLRSDLKMLVAGNDETRPALVVDATSGQVNAKLDVSR